MTNWWYRYQLPMQFVNKLSIWEILRVTLCDLRSRRLTVGDTLTTQSQHFLRRTDSQTIHVLHATCRLRLAMDDSCYTDIRCKWSQKHWVNPYAYYWSALKSLIKSRSRNSTLLKRTIFAKLSRDDWFQAVEGQLSVFSALLFPTHQFSLCRIALFTS